jgi:hypothetical protein
VRDLAWRSVAALAFAALSACSKHPPRACLEQDAPTPPGAAASAALTDARQRSPHCGRRATQCRFAASVEPDGIRVSVQTASFDGSSGECFYQPGGDAALLSTPDGVFRRVFPGE